MKRLIFCTITACILTTSLAETKGLKFSSEKNERYADSKDPKVGPTTIDSAQNLTWMRCAVGQEFDSEQTKACAGKPDTMTFQESRSFTKKVGKGWRLPTLWEVKGASEYVMKALSNGKAVASGKYGGGGWACEGKSVWTSTGVSDMPNAINMADCIGFTSGNNIRGGAVQQFGSDRASLILVR